MALNETRYRGAFAVTPSDTANTCSALALYVGTAGILKVTGADGVDVTFGAVTAGTLLPLVVTRVYSATTTASNIVALV